MTYTPEKIYAFSYTWSISNLALCPLRPGKRLFSPPFATESMENTKWRLVLYPKGDHNFEYMSLYLRREIDGTDLKEIVIDFKLTMTSPDPRFRFMKVSRNICFRETEIAGFSEFARWDSTIEVDRVSPFRTLMIFCELSPSDKISDDFRWNPRLDFKVLSQDFTGLYSSGQHHDTVLYSGGTEFYVHKAVLASRSPKFLRDLSLRDCSGSCTRMDMSGIPAPTLKTLLYFIYSGKLEIPFNFLPRGFYDVAQHYEVTDLVQRLRTLPKAYFAQTVLESKHTYVNWRVTVLSSAESDRSCFRRVLKSGLVTCGELVICCQVVHDTERGNGDYVNMSVRLTNPAAECPVSLLCVVSIVDKTAPLIPIVQLLAGYHVFESNPDWHQTFPVSDVVHLDVGATLHLGIDIHLCDGTASSFLDDEEVMLPDRCPIGMDDFREISNDFQWLLSSSAFADFSIVCGQETFRVHKAVLCARSQVFEKMLEHDMIEKRNGSVVVSDIRPTVMRLMLSYMYSGSLGDLVHEDVCDLYEAADRYAILVLKERCHYILVQNLNAQNVGRVLYIAQLHFDSCMEFHAENYLRSHIIDLPDVTDKDTAELAATNLPLDLTLYDRSKTLNDFPILLSEFHGNVNLQYTV